MEKKNLFDIKNGFDAKWFFFPFDIKNGFDAKWKNMKKSFYDKNGFFFILYGKNMPFLEKNHFLPQNHKTIFHFFPYNTPLDSTKVADKIFVRIIRDKNKNTSNYSPSE